MNTTSAVEKREKAVDYVTDEGIKVKVSYPDDVPENIRQQKINKMYDIFLGAMRRNGTEETNEYSGTLPNLITVTKMLLQISGGCTMI